MIFRRRLTKTFLASKLEDGGYISDALRKLVAERGGFRCEFGYFDQCPLDWVKWRREGRKAIKILKVSVFIIL